MREVQIYHDYIVCLLLLLSHLVWSLFSLVFLWKVTEDQVPSQPPSPIPHQGHPSHPKNPRPPAVQRQHRRTRLNGLRMPLQQHQHFRLDAAEVCAATFFSAFQLAESHRCAGTGPAIFMWPVLMEKTMKTMESQPFLGEQISDIPPFLSFLHLKKHLKKHATGASRARCRGAERSGPTAPTWGEQSSELVGGWHWLVIYC